jgi:predicted dienelactone hydrolase
VRIVVGSKDDQAVPDVNARPIAATIPNAELEVIPDVTHYTFLARCRLFGKVVARSFCIDPDSIDRDAVHRKVGADALAFFNRAMGRPLSEVPIALCHGEA